MSSYARLLMCGGTDDGTDADADAGADAGTSRLYRAHTESAF